MGIAENVQANQAADEAIRLISDLGQESTESPETLAHYLRCLYTKLAQIVRETPDLGLCCRCLEILEGANSPARISQNQKSKNGAGGSGEEKNYHAGGMSRSAARTFEASAMDFGKYAGERIEDVPISYLMWIAEDEFRAKLQRYLDSEVGQERIESGE